MRRLRLDKARESAPIVLNLIKDSGWCYAWGVVSMVTIIPVLSFQVYEIWKSRKEGTHKIMQNIAGMFAVMANGTWMVGDLYFHDGFHKYSKLLFLLGFIFIGLFAIFSWRQGRVAQKNGPDRVMMVSKETGSLIFVHSKLAHLHRRTASDHHHVMNVRHRSARR
jgi:hypothetical protein